MFRLLGIAFFISGLLNGAPLSSYRDILKNREAQERKTELRFPKKEMALDSAELKKLHETGSSNSHKLRFSLVFKEIIRKPFKALRERKLFSPAPSFDPSLFLKEIDANKRKELTTFCHANLGKEFEDAMNELDSYVYKKNNNLLMHVSKTNKMTAAEEKKIVSDVKAWLTKKEIKLGEIEGIDYFDGFVRYVKFKYNSKPLVLSLPILVTFVTGQDDLFVESFTCFHAYLSQIYWDEKVTGEKKAKALAAYNESLEMLEGANTVSEALHTLKAGQLDQLTGLFLDLAKKDLPLDEELALPDEEPTNGSPVSIAHYFKKQWDKKSLSPEQAEDNVYYTSLNSLLNDLEDEWKRRKK